VGLQRDPLAEGRAWMGPGAAFPGRPITRPPPLSEGACSQRQRLETRGYLRGSGYHRLLQSGRTSASALILANGSYLTGLAVQSNINDRKFQGAFLRHAQISRPSPESGGCDRRFGAQTAIVMPSQLALLPLRAWRLVAPCSGMARVPARPAFSRFPKPRNPTLQSDLRRS
jgi:hypothetical protein